MCEGSVFGPKRWDLLYNVVLKLLLPPKSHTVAFIGDLALGARNITPPMQNTNNIMDDSSQSRNNTTKEQYYLLRVAASLCMHCEPPHEIAPTKRGKSCTYTEEDTIDKIDSSKSRQH